MDIGRVISMFMDVFERKGSQMRMLQFENSELHGKVRVLEYCVRWGICTREKRAHTSNHSVPARYR